MSSAKPAEQQEKKHESFIRNGIGLTSIPAKVMALPDLEMLDVSDNAIEVVPKSLLPNFDKLKHLDLSHNCIKTLPDDLSALKLLEVLLLGHNKLTALPNSVYGLTSIQELNVSYNMIDYISDDIGQMDALHVLNVAGNRLRALPCEIGWLGLKQLNISENPELNVPEHVLQCGLRAVMCYLQVIGEQHQLIGRHMDTFTAKLRELQHKHGLVLGPLEDETAIAVRRKVALKFGVLACSHCQLTAVPAGLLGGAGSWDRVQVLELSHNRLKAAPQDLLQGLHKLLAANMSFNNIQTFSSTISLSSIAVLNLSFNKLSSLPDDLGLQLPGLQQLYLANNQLTHLPNTLDKLLLRDLFLSENAFATVPEVLQRCTGLMKLSLAACQLTCVDAELDGLSSLRFLDLSFNKLRSLPHCISSLVGVQRLNLGFNPLLTFPDVLTALTNLKELNMDCTGISSFTSGLGELGQLEGLQADGCPLTAPFAALYAKDPLLLVKLHDTQLLSLDLADVGLEEVPQQVVRLTKLTSLSLMRNAIKDLPLALGDLRQLQQLSLKGNPLRQPYVKVMDAKGELSLLAFLRPDGDAGVLNLEGCGFEGLPREVWETPGRQACLVELNLTNNRLKSLPEEVSTLSSLTQLVLDNNLLRALPPVVLTLPALAVLRASNNSITYLPESLGAAQQLQALLMHSNQLMQLPDSITALTNLRALGVTSNRLWQLPAGLASCSGLRLLDCSHNLLNKLPAGLAKLHKLRSLKLTHNKLGWISVAELKELPGLAELHLAGNLFTVDSVTNVSDPVAVHQLLAVLADGLAAEAPLAAQQTYSRNNSNISSNLDFTGLSPADGPKKFKSVRSRFGDDSHISSTLATSAPAAAPGRAVGVTWGDGDSNHSSSQSGAAATDGAASSSAGGGLNSTTRACSDLGSADTRSSTGCLVRRSSLDGGCALNIVEDAVQPGGQRTPAAGHKQQQSNVPPANSGNTLLQDQLASNEQPAVGSDTASIAALSHAAAGSHAPAMAVPATITGSICSNEGGISDGHSENRPSAETLQAHAAADNAPGRLTWAALCSREELAPVSRPLQSTGTGWDKVPLIELPSIIKALTAEPPPPPEQHVTAVGVGQHVRRPQSKARFRRVYEQTTRAMALLETMAAAGASADAEAEGDVLQ